MVLYRRNFVPSGTFFFTVNLHDRRRTHLVDHVDAFREIIRSVHKELPFVIDAMVILPDHWHAVWTLPPDDIAYSRRIRLIKSRFTRYLVRIGERIDQDNRDEYLLWQKRFWEHTIRNNTDLESHINYVHFNPVKHKHVERVKDWPHSTFHRYVEKGLLPADRTDSQPDGEFGE